MMMLFGKWFPARVDDGTLLDLHLTRPADLDECPDIAVDCRPPGNFQDLQEGLETFMMFYLDLYMEML